MDVKQIIADYLQQAKLMQLATAAGDRPWVCSVWFAPDEDLNIYWFSATTRRHSQEIAANPHVAAAIVLPQGPAEPSRGLQLEGVAEVLTNADDITKAHSFYESRIFSAEKIDELMNNPDRPHRFYRIKQIKYKLFDPVNFPDSPLQELEI